MGASTVGTLFGQKLAPALLDRYLAKTGFASQQTGEKVGPDRPNNLWEPHAPQLWFSHHAGLVPTTTAAADVTGLAAAITRWCRR